MSFNSLNSPIYYCPVVTPLREDGTVDLQGCEKFWTWLIDKGIKGFLVLGSLGEFHALSITEKHKVIDAARKIIAGRAELIIGVESNSQQATIVLAEHALAAGANAVMLLPPYYMPYSNTELTQYFDDVLPYIDGNVYLYNFPDCTGNSLSPELVKNIAQKHSNVVGIKDTVSTPATTASTIAAVKNIENFRVLCGLDTNFFHTLLSGGAGAIAGLSNAFPELIAAAIEAPSHGIAEMAKVQNIIDKASAIYSYTPSLSAAMKTAVKAREVDITTRCSGFSSSLSAEQQTDIENLVKEIVAEVEQKSL